MTEVLNDDVNSSAKKMILADTTGCTITSEIHPTGPAPLIICSSL